MKRLAVLLLLLLLLPLGSAAQLRPDLAHPLARGLVGWWRAVPGFTGGATWYDLMPAARHGTLTNMTGTASGWSATDRPGGYAQVNFDGVDDYVTVGTSTDFQFANATFTVTGWVKASNCATNTCYLVNKRHLGNGSWFLRIDTGGTLTARIDGLSGTAGARTTVTSTWADGQWRHFAAVITTDTTTIANNAVSVYTNGILDNGTFSQSDVYNPGTVPVAFGVEADNQASPLTGAMNDIRIYDRGLSASEVAALYAQSVRGDPDLLPGVPLMPGLMADLPSEAVSGATWYGVPPSMQSPGLLNLGHPLVAGLTDWWKALPGFTGGATMPNLMRLNALSLVNMAFLRTSGWGLGTSRPGGYSEMAFSGGGAADRLTSALSTAPTVTTQAISFCVWARPDIATKVIMELVSSQSGTSPYDGVRFALGDSFGDNFNTPYLQLIDTGTRIIGVRGPSDPTAGRWHHYCATYTGSGTPAGMAVYTDGQALTPTVKFSDTLLTGMTNRAWIIGTNTSPNVSYTFQGALDDIRIWSRALSAAEVLQVYQESMQGDAGLFMPPGVGAIPGAVAAAGPPSGAFFPFFR